MATRVPNITVAVDPPVSPLEGDQWWNTIIGQLFLWYNDGTSMQWVVANRTGTIGSVFTTDQPFIDIRGFGPSATVDSRAQLQAGMNAAALAKVPLDLAGGTWRCDGYLSLPSNLHMRNGGLDFSYLPMIQDNANYMLRAIGTLAPTQALLAVDGLADADTPQTVTLVPGGVAVLGGLAQDDMIFIRAPGQLWYSSVMMGETAIVKSVIGDVVTLYAPLRYSYLVAKGALMQKITAPMDNLIFRNLEITGSGTLLPAGLLRQGCFTVMWGRRALFDNVRIRNFNLFSVNLWGIETAKFLNGAIEDTPNWYGVGVGGPCRDVVIDGNRFSNNRHAVTVSSGATLGGGIPTDVIVSNNYIEGREASLDTHPWADKVTFSNNMIHCSGDLTENNPGGIMMQGRAMFAEYNKITGTIACGIYYQPAVLASTGLVGQCTMIGNTAETINPHSASAYAYQVLSGVSPASGLMIPVDRLIIDSIAKGAWAGGVKVQANNFAHISGWRIGGTYSDCLNTAIILVAVGGSEIRRGVIDGVSITMSDPAADFGIGIQAGTYSRVDAMITGTTISNVKSALRRLGSVGDGAVHVNAQIVTNATNIVEAPYPAAWVTGHFYKAGDRVSQLGSIWLCLIEHTSGDWSADVTGLLWTERPDADSWFVNGHGVRKYSPYYVADYDISTSDTGWSFSNEDATAAINFWLPQGVTGLSYKFFCLNTYDLVVHAGAGDVIWLGGTATAAGGGIVATNPGGVVELFCQNGTDWYAMGNTGFVISGAPPPVAYFFDFMAGALPAGVAVARAGAVGPYFNSSGTYQNAAANAARFDYSGSLSLRGMHNEASTTNAIRNSSGSGAVSGTPGTQPTNWVTTTTVNGVTRTITAGVVESGMQCVDFHYAGTPTAPFTVGVAFETTTGGGAAAVGQIWTSSFYIRLIDGTWDNVGTIYNSILQYDVGGGFLASLPVAITDPTADPLVIQRSIATITLTAAAVAKIANQIRMAVVTGLTIDFTIRVALPNLTLEDMASSPIQTSGTALTRASELVTLTMAPGFYDIDIQYNGASSTVSNVDVSGGSYVVPRNSNMQLQSVTAYEV